MKSTNAQKRRMLVVLVIFLAMSILLVTRVAWIQIADGADLQEKASLQQNSGSDIPPKRGSILDRNGTVLAVSATADTISVNPKELQERYGANAAKLTGILDGLAEILTLTPKERSALTDTVNKASMYEIVKSKVDKDIGDRVRDWMNANNVFGVNIDQDFKRFYPKDNLAAHVIGFTSFDNIGIDGIEKYCEQYLRGSPGKILSEVDILGRELPFSKINKVDATDGLNVTLTIDSTIQYFVQKDLQIAVKDSKVLEGATVIVMDPRNGDVLAMVSLPDFNLNTPWAAPAGVDATKWTGSSAEDVATLQQGVWRNKAISFTYEPGSTFKTITSAAGLEEGVITPESRVDDFPVNVGWWTINCWQFPPHGEENFITAVYNSCNPVFVKVAQQLGLSRFYKYMRAFGFMEKTQIELYGESDSIIHTEPSETDMAVASFGQRFQITPIQLITAYSAVANGGSLMKPRLVKELTDANGNVVKKFEPEVVRTVISKKTSDSLKAILEGVVTYGTGHNAYIRGYRLAGKTGTSETISTTENGRLISSFMTFAPADNPVVSILIILDHPDAVTISGGYLAAPVAGKMMEQILNYLGVERKYTAIDEANAPKLTSVPDVTGQTIDQARATLESFGLKYSIETAGAKDTAVVVQQNPPVYTELASKSVVVLYTEKPQKETMVMMPDLLNMNIDEALLTLNNIGLNIKVSSLGTITKQSVPYGQAVSKGTVIEVELQPLNLQ